LNTTPDEIGEAEIGRERQRASESEKEKEKTIE